MNTTILILKRLEQRKEVNMTALLFKFISCSKITTNSFDSLRGNGMT